MERKRNGFESFFLRMLLPLLLALVLAIAAIAFFGSIYQSDQQEIYRIEKEQKLNQMADSVSAELKQLEYQQLKLLSDSRVSHLAYAFGDLTPFEYYDVANELSSSISLLVDSFSFARSFWLYFGDLDIALNETGRTGTIPFSPDELRNAGMKNICVKDNRIFIVRSLMDLVENSTRDICYSILEVEKDLLAERFSWLCSDAEQILLIGNGSVINKGTVPNSPQTIHTKLKDFDIDIYLEAFPGSYQLSGNVLTTAIVACIVLFVILILSFFLYAYLQLYKPLKLLLVEAFSHMSREDFSYRIKSNAGAPFEEIYQAFNNSIEKLEYLTENVYRQRLLISEMKLKQLQAQISPHFMFNTYYTLYRTIQAGKWEISRQLAGLLGAFYQYITRSGNSERPLWEETEHTMTYIRIQAIRFQTMHQEIDELPESMREITVPQLIFQPVVENVFQHARDSLQPDEPLFLRIRYLEEKQIACIRVENNGSVSDEVIDSIRNQLEAPEMRSEMTGLLNIHHRLKLFFGEEAGLQVRRSELGGFCVEIRILR